ncbi:protein PIN-LIKES 7-like [Rutidosis leptorrhynchoides]|uniref:protein PIN-LIKES 7-like n=1 Tax=Rutidosis leptorrhynchoides TaxID=125765 RepID=UPI003A991F73
MGFWSLFETASMPILEVLLVSAVGAVMATDYFNLLSNDTRKSLNKIVFVAFTPSLIFASLAKTVTLEEIISWWFMPINIGITFICGGMLGWIAAKLIKPKPHLEGLLIAMCSTGNLGNILLIIVPAICTEGGSPFGEHSVCKSKGLSYSSFSMAFGSFCIWTYTFQLLKNSSSRYTKLIETEDSSHEPNKESDANEKTHLLNGETQEYIDVVVPLSYSTSDDTQIQPSLVKGLVSKEEKKIGSFSSKLTDILHSMLKELMAPPNLGSIVGFVFGATPWLKKLVIGDDAPLRVIQDSITLLGDGTIPCITLILGGNLIQGLRKASIKPIIIIAIICVRYVILPIVGILVIKAATNLGLLPSDPLFNFVLLIQYTVPPATNISTMTQLFNVGQEECSVLIMWSYLAAAFALTGWSTVFMWILT